MSMTDPIADLLTRIRNAVHAKKPVVDIPRSNVKREIIRILKDEKYIRDYTDIDDTKQGILRVHLNYARGDQAVVKGIQRVSRPGLRQYMGSDDVRQSTFSLRGVAILSTSSGVMTNHEAAQRGVGGEVLCRVW